MNIKEIRKQYPQYQDLSDEQLAQGFYKKYYSDIDYNDFKKQIGLFPKQNFLETTNAGLQAINRGIMPFYDEAKNAITSAVVSPFANNTNDENASYWEKVKSNYGLLKERDKEQQEANPILSTVGEITGSIASPLNKVTGAIMGQPAKLGGKIAKGALTGGIQGAISSLDRRDIDEWGKNTAKDVALSSAIGGAIPVIAESVKQVSKIPTKTYNYIKGNPEKLNHNERGSFDNLLSSKKGSTIIRKAIQSSSPEEAQSIKNQLKERVEKTSEYIRKNISEYGGDSAEKRYQEAVKNYNRYIEKNADKQIKDPKIFKIIEKKPVKEAMQFIADYGDDLQKARSLNTIGGLQDIKHHLSQEARRLGESGVEKNLEKSKIYQDIANEIKDLVEEKAPNFKKLNQYYAKAIQDRNLAKELINETFKKNENTNIANSLLNDINKSKILKSFGERNGKNLIEALRKESDIVSGGAGGRTGARALSGIQEIPFWGVGEGLSLGALMTPFSGVGATNLGLKAALRYARRQALKEALQPMTKKSQNHILNALQKIPSTFKTGLQNALIKEALKEF